MSETLIFFKTVHSTFSLTIYIIVIFETFAVDTIISSGLAKTNIYNILLMKYEIKYVIGFFSVTDNVMYLIGLPQ